MEYAIRQFVRREELVDFLVSEIYVAVGESSSMATHVVRDQLTILDTEGAERTPEVWVDAGAGRILTIRRGPDSRFPHDGWDVLIPQGTDPADIRQSFLRDINPGEDLLFWNGNFPLRLTVNRNWQSPLHDGMYGCIEFVHFGPGAGEGLNQSLPAFSYDWKTAKVYVSRPEPEPDDDPDA